MNKIKLVFGNNKLNTKEINNDHELKIVRAVNRIKKVAKEI